MTVPYWQGNFHFLLHTLTDRQTDRQTKATFCNEWNRILLYLQISIRHL